MTISPSKGKAKEDDHWNVGWWEFHSLVEQPRRPVEWSDVSVIFTAHPSQPMITGRHFSSSKSFVIQPQTPKANAVTAYAPPSLIVCSAGSEWLFAYFPGIGGDGLACIWKRGAQIDVWAQRHVWNVPRNAGVVAAHWAGAHREWTFDAPSNQPKHLPPMGPRVPVSNPALFLVTQDRRIHVWFIRVLSQHFQCIHLPLNQPGQHAEDLRQPATQSPPSDPPVPPGGMQLCTHATIGTTYNEPSLLIATRSCVYPVPSDNFASADLNMSMGLPPSMPDDTQNWASFGEKDAIEITEVQLAFNTIYLGECRFFRVESKV
ncbi:hypothetical protein ONZ45_g17396 [Pleurotus djamor]|nr:hypothetical protein ONZ45_g17396 [Pleurotus djamor]